MEDEKLADKLLDRILMVLMPYDQIDVERIKAKLTVVLDDYQICPKQEALVVYTEGKNDYYLRKFLLAKAVAGRQERTLRQYKDEVGRALRGIGKDADTITADDIQVYLAKVLSRGGSKCYCDNIRRDLSSFYNWLYREEIIRTNPMNKIDNIKFKREKEKALTDMEIEMMRQACQTTMQKGNYGNAALHRLPRSRACIHQNRGHGRGQGFNSGQRRQVAHGVHQRQGFRGCKELSG